MEDNIQKNNCVFCSIPEDRVIKRFENFFVIEDAFPERRCTLIISNRHISSYFDLSHEEQAEIPLILDELKRNLENRDASIRSFNIGINAEKLQDKLSCTFINI